MPEKGLDFWLWLYALLTGPKMTVAFWAGIGGAVRVVVMHRAGAKTTWSEFFSTLFLAIVFGTAFYPIAIRLSSYVFGPTVGALLNLTDDQTLPAAVVTLGVLGAAAFGFMIDFTSKWFELRRGGK